MNFPKFLRLIVLPRIEHIQINSTHSITKTYIHPSESELAALFAKMYKFSYEFIPPPDGEVGRQLPNGTWTGMAGTLLRNEGDLIISILTIRADRMEYLDFGFPQLRSPITFVTSEPVYSSDIRAFLKPFDAELWIALAAFLLILSIIFFAFLRERCTYGKILLAVYRSLITQPLCISPQNAKEYVLMFFYIIGAVFFVHSYTCVLLSFITFPTLTGVQTIPELAAAVLAGTYQCISYAGTFVGAALASSKDPNFRIVGRNLLQNKGSSDVFGILKSSSGKDKKAFVAASDALMPFKTAYLISKDEFFPIFFAIGMRKDFCCRELISRFVLSICSTGLYQKLFERHVFRVSLRYVFESDENADSSLRQFSLEDVAGAFVVLCTGYALSVAAFIFEIIFQRFSKNFQGSSGHG